MKISLNKLRYAGEHYDVPELVPDGIDALVEKIGSQLGAIEEVIPYSDRFDGVIIVKVVSCAKHPNADKLSVCKIDDGGKVKDVKRDSDGFVQVVCGAPNVRADMLAAWLPPGATVPASRDKEPFVLEARDIRGHTSNGMLASPKELGIGDDHDGILEVDVDARPGTLFAKAYRAEGETVIDIENKMFTHRPDCFGMLGITREVAGIQHKPFKSPAWYTPNPKFPAMEADELKLEVRNELPESVPRFTAVTMSVIKVGPSPVWLQIFLSEVGIRPINNIVDYTNFWMLETGQPLHAYDYDKVEAFSEGDGATIVIRNPKPGEKITLLGGKSLEPRPEAIMIATDKQAIGIGGVMGGSETEVDKNTKNIILECANFDMYSIRRTSMAHGLFTDAVTRFTKGQSPLQNLAVLAKIVDHIREHAGGKVAGQVIDNKSVPEAVIKRGSLHPKIAVTPRFINERLGLDLSGIEIRKLLTNVEFKLPDIEDNSKDASLEVLAPFWRTDIELREDVVEEVGRLYGYDKLPLVLPQRDLTPAQRNPLLELKAQIRERLSKAGANEVLTYSFVPGSLLEKTIQDKTKAFEIANALSPDLQYYRLALWPSLLDKVHPNIKAGYDEFALFELGKTHYTDAINDDGLPWEYEALSLVYAARKNSKPGAAYYEARQFLVDLAAELGHPLAFKPLAELKYTADSPFEPGRSATVFFKSKQPIGIIGEFKASVRKNLKLPDKSAGFEIADLRTFLQPQVYAQKYVPMSRFPKVTQDITLKVPAEVRYHHLELRILEQIRYAKPAGSFTKLEPLDIFQSPDDAKHKNVTFRLTITSYDRTLTDPEVNKLLDDVAEAAKAKFKAERV